MVYISRKAEFCASHRLYNPRFSSEQNEEIYGCCNNINGHGHNYVLEVILKGDADADTGMVMDLKELKRVIDDEIVERVDHKNLNVDVDFLAGVIPTTENIVVGIWNILEEKLPPTCELYEVRLWESDKNMAFYRGEGAELVRQDVRAAGAAAGKN